MASVLSLHLTPAFLIWNTTVAHRADTARHVRKLAYFVARFGATVASLALAKRPLSIWWAMYQIKALVPYFMPLLFWFADLVPPLSGVQLWKTDPSLTDALEQSLEFLAVVDFMSVMWPSERTSILLDITLGSYILA